MGPKAWRKWKDFPHKNFIGKLFNGYYGREGFNFAQNKDILRLGMRQLGSFTLKESYEVIVWHERMAKDAIWSKLWFGFQWPKVTFFLWLSGRRQLLTWDCI